VNAHLTVRIAAFVTPPAFAVILTLVTEVTVRVVTVAVAEVEPAGTVTLAGTVATLLFELASVTITPTAAGPVRVSFAVEGPPPGTALGLRVSDARTGALTVSLAVLIRVRYVAEMFT